MVAGIVKILYSEPDYLMLYRCDVISDGSCTQDGVYAAILGRSRTDIDYDKLVYIYTQIGQRCVLGGDTIRTNLQGEVK